MSRNATLLGLLALLLALGSAPASAQMRTVTGTVTDARTGDPLPFVNVVIDGTVRGAATNVDGEYSIDVDGPETLLTYRFLGYVTATEVVGARRVIDVEMSEDSNVLDDVVVVGYGTQRRGDVTGSVSTVEIDDANDGLVTAPTDFLEGRVAGVNVIETSGEPGANVEVRIRGGTSIASSNQPLYVIDGIPISGAAVTPGGAGDVSTGPAPNPLTLINPNDIESMTVLKDASATAIYGSRGANGVILITTKGGREGLTTIDYEGSTSFSTAASRYDIASADELRTEVGDLARRTGSDPDAAVGALGDADTDFQDEVFRDAVSQTHNLSFSGGATNAQYRASVSYLDEEGIVVSSGQQRVTGRLNANSQFLDGRLRVGLNLTSALTNNDFVPANATGGAEGGIFQNLLDFQPTFDINDEDSPDGFFEQGGAFAPRNPVALAEQIDESARTTRTLGNIQAELDLFQGLSATFNLGGDRSVGRREGFFSRFSPVTESVGGSGFQRDLELTSVTVQGYLTYTLPTRGDHSLTVLGGSEYSEYDTREASLQATTFLTDVLGANRLNLGENVGVVDGAGVGPGTFTFRSGYRLSSFLSRVNYGFADRYFLTGVLRADGSSRFSSENEFGFFPAVSAAWRVSEEPFFENVGLFSDLRVRAGFGIVGNQALPGDNLSRSLLAADPNLRAVLGGQIVTGVAPNQLANPDLKWEEKQEFTVGLDYGVLGGRVFGSLEFYRNTTDDLLLRVGIPAPTPVPSQIQNIGSIRNTGVDFGLDGLLYQSDNLTFSVGATFSTNANEVLDIGVFDEDGNAAGQLFTGTISGRGQSNQTSLLLAPGQPYPVFYGAEFTGDFDGDGNPLYNDYEDTTGDGFNDNLVGTTISPNASDDRIIGDPRPDFTYGLRLNLEAGPLGFRAFLRGEQGRQLFNNTDLVYSSQGNLLSGFNRIQRDFDEAENPNAAAVFSDRFIEDASFLRLDQLTIEYNLTDQIVQRSFGAAVRTARLFVTGNNLFVITPYSGVDPEVNANASQGDIQAIGIDYLPYPRARTFTVGVNLGL